MTAENKYLCWREGKKTAYAWENARPVDKFKDLKKCYKLGARIEHQLLDGNWGKCKTTSGKWCEPAWVPNRIYRIKDGITPEQFLKHHKEILAYWDGKKIEYCNKSEEEWKNTDYPSWHLENRYRIKEKSIYYYQWEKLTGNGNTIETLGYATDEYAEDYNYTGKGWRKIETSKRTWND